MSAVAPQLEPAGVDGTRPIDPGPLSQGSRNSITGRIGLALLGVWLVSGIYVVMPDQQGVEVMFGRVAAARIQPGMHYAAPWPVVRVVRLKVRQLQRSSIGGDLSGNLTGRTQPLLSQFLTGDQNMIHLRAVVQYSVSQPVEYLFHSENPSQLVNEVVDSQLARALARQSVDSVLTTERVAIQNEVRGSAQRILDGYQAGVAIGSVSIESVTPPPEAAAAFRDVASARADTARTVSDAQGYANDLLPRARGQAQQMLEEAEGYKRKKIDEAEGDALRFSQVAAEYAKAAQVSARRLYMETLEEILPRIKKLIVDPNGNLDLTIIRKGAPPAK